MIRQSMMLLIALLALQPPHPTSVWDGVYTAAQAERGGAVYEVRCRRCHAGDQHGVNGSSLAGEAFMLHWEGRTIDRLLRRIRDTMPPDAAGTMTETDAVDAVAFLLQRNSFPEGATELAPEPTVLAGIQIRSSAGPAVVRNGALVQTTGCLIQNPDDGWMLNDATEPEITTLDAPSTWPGGPRSGGAQPVRTPNPAEAARPAAIVRGSRTIALVNVFPNPADHKGHTMRATGFIVRQPAGDRVNVVTLELVEPRCDR
jgi:S-disulfanyl-L-cysteine oxidoreductase SoxD